MTTPTPDLDELLALRDVCSQQIAAGLDAHSLAAIMRQLVGVSAEIAERAPSTTETYVEWMQRRRAAMRVTTAEGLTAPRFTDDAEADAFLAEWTAANPAPERPIPRFRPQTSEEISE
ncbi:hypothetical protein [Flexivirga sp. B27]